MITNTQFEIATENDMRYVHLQPHDDAIPAGSETANAPLVLLHGMFGGISNYDYLASKLQTTGQEVWIPELPLCQAPKNVTVKYLGDWLHRFLRHFNIQTPILMGNSMGGHLALDVCLRKQFEPKALVLTGSSGLFEEQFGDSTPKRFDRSYVRHRIEQTFEHFEVTEEMVDNVMAILGDRKKLFHMVSLARSTHRYNVREKLSRITCPVLLVWGRQDQITPPRVAEEFYERLPNARLRWIDQCGHAPMMEHPDRFFAEVKPFIDRLDHYRISHQQSSNLKESTLL
jgi:2-hydroxy-6-oxonona-2,4-dienedioate hydrolase